MFAVIPLSQALDRYSIDWMQFDWPLDRTSVFGFDGALDVEIGFGNGAFLADLARHSPERQFFGIERSLGSLTRLFSRLERDTIQNVRVIQADASFAFDHLFGPGDVSRLFLNFPDPWPKERHHSRRLIQPSFVERVSCRLGEDGELFIGTDHCDYATWITEVLESQSALRSKHDTTFVSEIPGRRPTKYEQKAREAGSKIRFYEWVKNPAPLDAVREEKIEDMPNALLEGEIDVKDLMKDLGSKTWKLKDQGVIVVVKLGHIYREEPSGNLLLEVMVREDAFSQHFGIVAVQRPPNRLLVKLSPIGYPRPTWGVKQAVRLVSERLIERANLTVVSSTLAEPVVPDGWR